jgi:hypothetical protein
MPCLTTDLAWMVAWTVVWMVEDEPEPSVVHVVPAEIGSPRASSALQRCPHRPAPARPQQSRRAGHDRPRQLLAHPLPRTTPHAHAPLPPPRLARRSADGHPARTRPSAVSELRLQLSKQGCIVEEDIASPGGRLPFARGTRRHLGESRYSRELRHAPESSHRSGRATGISTGPAAEVRPVTGCTCVVVRGGGGLEPCRCVLIRTPHLLPRLLPWIQHATRVPLVAPWTRTTRHAQHERTRCDQPNERRRPRQLPRNLFLERTNFTSLRAHECLLLHSGIKERASPANRRSRLRTYAPERALTKPVRARHSRTHGPHARLRVGGATLNRSRLRGPVRHRLCRRRRPRRRFPYRLPYPTRRDGRRIEVDPPTANAELSHCQRFALALDIRHNIRPGAPLLLLLPHRRRRGSAHEGHIHGP